MLDPRIGMLSSGRYYCFPTGYAKPELIGTLSDVEVALGLRPLVSRKAKKLQRYAVTVSPRVVAHAGSWCGDEHTIEVDAYSNADAIKRVRQQRNEEEGRYGVKATYRAKRVY